MDPNQNQIQIRNHNQEHQQQQQQQQGDEEEEEEEDYFDLLPDAILHLIFNKMIDARSLIRCLAVSKRFASLISQSDTVFLAIPRPVLDSKGKSRIFMSGRSPANSTIRFLLRKLVITPFRFIRRVISSRTSPESSSGFGDWYYWPSVALKELRGIKFVHVELPCCGDEIGSSLDGGPLLKWKAEFGTELNSCVVLGASSLRRKSIRHSDSDAEERELEPESESEMGDEDLKLRIVWTISSLIAASMRHYLVKQMITDFPMLQSVVITDSTKQGRLHMEEKQVTELKTSMKTSNSNRERTVIPDLNMKMWHVPVLDLPASGYVMTAATLVVIRPSAASGTDLDGLGRMGDDFDAEEGEKLGAYGEAVRKLMKFKRNYALEVNSF